MRKILFLTDSEALKNLVIKNKNYEFEFFTDEKNLAEFLTKKSSENFDFSLLILDQIVTQTEFINHRNLKIISFFKDQQNLNQIHFLSKPVHITELLSAIAILTKDQERKSIEIGDCVIDFESRFIKKIHDQNSTDSETKLTEIEVKILDFFLNEPTKEKTKSEILRNVWNHKNSDQMADTGLVEVTLNKLKKKLKELGIDELINFRLS